jgi:hypothetical protein
MVACKEFTERFDEYSRAVFVDPRTKWLQKVTCCSIHDFTMEKDDTDYQNFSPKQC